MIAEIIKKQIKAALERAALIPRSPEGEVGQSWDVELTKDFSHGDYASNIALIAARQLGSKPNEIAEKLLPYLGNDSEGYIEKVEIAGPGFLNFFVSDKYLESVIANCELEIENFGRNKSLSGQKVMVEYTDPNVMKPFHIGHLMSNAIGEAISRMYESAGAEVTRVNYFSDVGLAIAKAVWGMKEMKQTMPNENVPVIERTDFLGKAYAFGVKQADESVEVMTEVKEINRQIYIKQEGEFFELYKTGRKWSLEHFAELYKKLGTNFDLLIPESDVAKAGLEMSWQALKAGVFIESEGAVVFPETKSGLHTRVFVTKEQLPTYEAKELALTKKKYELSLFDQSIVITASEQTDYFKVVLRAIDLLIPELAGKTLHVAHGMMRLPTGKMSSRTGNVITGEELIRLMTEKSRGNEQVAIGAIKYAILRQAPGKDIIFDVEKALSLEGDSGPYLQYAYARTKSVLAKAKESNYELGIMNYEWRKGEKKLIRIISRWPDILRSAQENLVPQAVCTYLIELAGEFNSFYASNQIINPDDKQTTEMRLALTEALAQTLANGLWTLGVPVLDKM